MKIYTGGTFSILHIGQANFLYQCKKLGNVTVALNKDDFIERFKGRKPIFSYEERKAILERTEWVDEVIPNEYGEDSKPTILKVMPDIIAIGTDWAKKDYCKQMGFTWEWLEENSIGLIYIPYFPYISTSEIKRRLK